MNNFKKITAAALAISFSFLGTSVVGESNLSFASENKNAPKIDLGIQQSNVPYQESVVKLNQNDKTRQEFMNKIVALRSKAWDDNLILTWSDDDGDTKSVRDIYNYWSDGDPEGYKNAFVYNYGLERLALQRAYELTLTGNSLQRPDGSDNSTMNYKSYSLGNASTIWAFDDKQEIDVDSFFEVFASDKDYDDFKNAKGKQENVQLETILNYQPTQLAIGYGQVTNKQTGRSFAVLAFDLDPNVWSDKVDYVGDYTMSFGNPNFKKPSKESLDRLEASVKKAKQTIAGAEVLTKSMPNFAEKNSSALNRLIENQRIIISKAEAILRANGR